ncbi:unnamed protein product [marine sediment metagenome]|uniref:Uncharacterized protein n=1 Tax=marine sediment metagenome TaxID=412755 RepID=X1GSW7_9ZZZZ
MISEVEFFNEIFENFLSLDNHILENELWKAHSIIKLMHNSVEFEDENFVELGLKIIISLCKFKECGDLLDSYEQESYPVNQLVESEKILLNSILQAEFI